MPVVYFEGAIALEETKGGSAPKSTTERYIYPFVEGQKLSGALQDLYTILSAGTDVSKESPSKESLLSRIFSSEADLKNAYIIRSGEKLPIPVDIEALIHNYTEEKDIILKPYDLIVIPLWQYHVTVSGRI